MKIHVWKTPVPDTTIKSVSGAVTDFYGDVKAATVM